MRNTCVAKALIAMVFMVGMKAPIPSEAKNIHSSELTLFGRGWDISEKYSIPFARIPYRLLDNFNDNAKKTIPCTAGLYFHFSTDSRNIGATYTLWSNLTMAHQAGTGTRGLDLYVYDKENGRWVYLNTHKPDVGITQNVNFGLSLDGTMHDFLIYFPLYDGVTDFSLVVDDNARVLGGNNAYLDPMTRVAVYGTSITQGGCASRPGMAGTSILGRRLKCQVLNYGFSSGGLLELTAAQALTEVKNISVYVLDVVPNASAPLLLSNLYDFVSILAKANSAASFVFVEALNPSKSIGTWGCEPDNNRQRLEVERLRADFSGRKFEIVKASDFSDTDGEGSVDGIHYTDLGFMTWARVLTPVVQRLLDNANLSTSDVRVGRDHESVTYYNIHGMRLDAPKPGINIELYSDGSVRKIIK